MRKTRRSLRAQIVRGIAFAIMLITGTCFTSALLSSCSSAPIYEPADFRNQVASSLPSINPFFSRLRELSPTVIVLCMYGFERNDTTYVLFLLPAEMDYSAPNGAGYAPCPQPDPKSFGKVRYIGTQHNHPSGSCGFSPTDVRTFQRDSAALLDAVTCADGTIVQHKPISRRASALPQTLFSLGNVVRSSPATVADARQNMTSKGQVGSSRNY